MPTSTCITEGIRVSVFTRYVPQDTPTKQPKYIFAYQIEIKNESLYVVQLLSREWHITNAWAGTQIVQGEGVVGRQPIISPGESHTYMSGTHFPTRIGKMEGTFLMRRLGDNEMITVKIPTFVMAVPYSLN